MLFKGWNVEGILEEGKNMKTGLHKFVQELENPGECDFEDQVEISILTLSAILCGSLIDPPHVERNSCSSIGSHYATNKDDGASNKILGGTK